MKTATWNVNSIRSRLPHLTAWLAQNSPDVIMLQEIKTVADTFPFKEIEEIGYQTQMLGQKSYNGVATLSKLKSNRIKDSILEGDDSARYLEVEINGIRFINVYVPNGNPIETKLDYKHSWLDSLTARIEALLKEKQKFIIGGDFNLIPEPIDAHNFKSYEKDAVGIASVRAYYKRWQDMGILDVFRLENKDTPDLYSWWDYRTSGFKGNRGLRIDYLLTPPYLKCQDSKIDTAPRALEKPSDHTIVLTNIVL